MNERNSDRQVRPGITDRIGSVEYSPGEYREEARAFLGECLKKELYDSVMSSAESRSHPYIAARVFLNNEQWAKYVWIEQHGSLEGFTE